MAGLLSGIKPVWASEVSPYPIAVTKSKFPWMEHLGNVCNVKGYEIQPVDIISLGSPCQDWSQAGAKKGLEGSRSSLFYEAIRIIKEMKEVTSGKYPKFAVFENVMGLFSSKNGEDFRTVLEELIKIVEPEAIMPPVPKGGWAHADCYCGDGWSLAYRVLDSQYIRTAQRRKRIYLVLDLVGDRAFPILFERESLRGNYPQIGQTWKTASRTILEGFEPSYGEDEISYELKVGADISRTVYESHPMDSRVKELRDNVSPTVSAKWHKGTADTPLVVEETLPRAYDARGNGDGLTVNTITGDHENRITDYTSVIIDAYGVGNGQANQAFMHEQVPTLNCMHDQQSVAIAYGCDCRNGALNENLYPTLQAKPNGGQSLNYSGACITASPDYVVRRLTPVECARLQGFFDDWGEIDVISDWSYTDHIFWSNVRRTNDEINGKEPKEYSEKQMQSWYNKLHTDTAEYRLWGNGVALPCVLYLMQGIADTYIENAS